MHKTAAEAENKEGEKKNNIRYDGWSFAFL